MPEEAKNPKSKAPVDPNAKPRAEAPAEERKGPDPVAAGSRKMTDRARNEFGDSFDPETGMVRAYCLTRKRWMQFPAIDAREALYGPPGHEGEWEAGITLDGPEGK